MRRTAARIATAPTEPSTCRVCGCSAADGCWPGCWWIEPDLCSACAADGGIQARRVMGIDAADLLHTGPADVRAAGGAS